jgi:hypothetical protein
MQEAGREWFGAVRQGPSSSSIHSAFPEQCSASWPLIPAARDRSRSSRRIDNTEPGTVPPCSVPAGADKNRRGSS